MDSLLQALPALGCALMLPAMFLMMRGGMQKTDPPPPTPGPDRARDEELAKLREEVAQLRSQVDAETRSQDPAGR